MNLTRWMVEAIGWLYGLAGLFALCFMIIYVPTAWRKHAWGRHVMAFTVVVELILVFGFLRRIVGPFPGYIEINFVLALAFAVVMFQRLWVQWTGSRPRPPVPSRRRDDEDRHVVVPLSKEER